VGLEPAPRWAEEMELSLNAARPGLVPVFGRLGKHRRMRVILIGELERFLHIRGQTRAQLAEVRIELHLVRGIARRRLRDYVDRVLRYSPDHDLVAAGRVLDDRVLAKKVIMNPQGSILHRLKVKNDSLTCSKLRRAENHCAAIAYAAAGLLYDQHPVANVTLEHLGDPQLDVCEDVAALLVEAGADGFDLGPDYRARLNHQLCVGR